MKEPPDDDEPPLLSLFDVPPADQDSADYEVPTSHNHRQTSRESTIHKPDCAGKQRGRVLECVFDHTSGDGVTMWDVADECHMLLSSSSARLHELAGGWGKRPYQYIVEAGFRKTPTGSMATVWKVLEKPVAVLFPRRRRGKKAS